MAEIEKVKKIKKKSGAKGVPQSQPEERREDEADASNSVSVRDLVKSAGAALGGLFDDEPVVVAAMPDTSEAEVVVAAADVVINDVATGDANDEGSESAAEPEQDASGSDADPGWTESIELIESIESVELTGSTDGVGLADSAESSDPVDLAESTESTDSTEFIDADQLISVIESLLFSTDKPVSMTTIKQIFKGSNVRTKDIARALDGLASEYASSKRGVTLEEIGGGYQLRSKSDNAAFLRRLAKVRPFRLSGPALEVMSIIAYKQPVSKHEIDEIRGVESGHLLRALMERSLVCFNGKSESLPGKPMTYGSTRKFLEIFGLRNLKELPTLNEIDEILPEGIGEEQEKETLSDLTDRLSAEVAGGGYSEGEDELFAINEQLQRIDTTTEFFEQEKQRERERKDRERAQDIREKLVLGDEVDEKDRRWLDRYEAKLAAIEAAAQSGAPLIVPVDEVESVPDIGDQLQALTEEYDAMDGRAGTHSNWDEDDAETVADTETGIESDQDI